MPAWMSRYFSWQAVPAHIVGMTGRTVDGKLLAANDLIYPCAGSLCQGFSWSLYFAQRANEQVCGGVSNLKNAVLASDRGGPIVLRVGKSCENNAHFYVYVDNLGVLDLDSRFVRDTMEQLQEKFNEVGLQLHASEVSLGSVEALGCLLEGGLFRSRLQPKRLWKVHQAIAGLLRRGRCSGQTMEKIMGHCTFCALMNRRSLACFHAVYAFIQSNCFTHLGHCQERAYCFQRAAVSTGSGLVETVE